MIRIGMIGSDSSHADRFSELCNLPGFAGGVRGARVVSIWGQDPKRTAEVAEHNRIARIVEDPAEMLGEVDAVMIVLRHGGLHCQHALPFLEAGIAMFVDKPFALALADARWMVHAARGRGTPLASYSCIRYAPAVVGFLKGLKKIAPITAGVSAGPGDLKSQYGGLMFYGIHAIEMMQETFGSGVRRVSAAHHAGNVVATVEYRADPIVSLQVLGNAGSAFHVAAYGKGGADHCVLDLTDCYPAGLRVFLKMVRTGREPIPHETMLEAVAVGEAVEKSLRLGRPVSLPAKLL